ncbi:YuzF family protein [Clostridium ganghwense]|uniref:YuzF family protein n=2 Tax=Clostridium ganghwense TaxID=312089 RepID=A0ABT4CT10_9CLOT|nr:YuzF family protein [Clostridium ganghwense]
MRVQYIKLFGSERMNYQLYQMPMMQSRQPIKYVTLIDPYVVEALRMIIGQSVVIETVRGNIQGILEDVKPDHVVVKTYDSDTVFYVRLQQIVHVMPN